MDEQEFRDQLAMAGYGEPTTNVYPPDTDGAFHTHEFSAMLLVTEGEFRLVLEEQTEVMGVGDWCEVPAGTVHYEQSGANGASVLAGKK